MNQDGSHSASTNFINNGLVYLFSEIRYEINGATVDMVKNPGITSTIKSLISYTKNEVIRLEHSGLTLDANPTICDVNGNFTACIPLSMLLGFAEDYNKIIVNINQQLVLVRSNTDVNAIQTTIKDVNPKITIDEISWKIQHIELSDKAKLSLMNTIPKNIHLRFRSWELIEQTPLPDTDSFTWFIRHSTQIEKPRYVIVSFQTNLGNQPNTNMSQFHHCNVTNIQFTLNSKKFPFEELNLNFDNNEWSLAYEMLSQFQEFYYYRNPKRENQCCISRESFFKSYPFFVIDCSRQDESQKNGQVILNMEIKTNKKFPPQTTAYCLVLFDRHIVYNALDSTVKVLSTVLNN